MRGLRTQESNEFQKFFSIVQAEAMKRDSVFFADAGDGHDFSDEGIACEDLMGWLVPHRLAEEFEPLWLVDEVDDSWTEFFVWAIWSKENGSIAVHFEG